MACHLKTIRKKKKKKKKKKTFFSKKRPNKYSFSESVSSFGSYFCFCFLVWLCSSFSLVLFLVITTSPGQKIMILAPCHTTTPYPPRILMQTQWNNDGLISPRSKYTYYNLVWGEINPRHRDKRGNVIN